VKGAVHALNLWPRRGTVCGRGPRVHDDSFSSEPSLAIDERFPYLVAGVSLASFCKPKLLPEPVGEPRPIARLADVVDTVRAFKRKRPKVNPFAGGMRACKGTGEAVVLEE
jgi:hypothetical protein